MAKELLEFEKPINVIQYGEALLSDKQLPVTVEDALLEKEQLESHIKWIEKIVERYVETEFYDKLNELLRKEQKKVKQILNLKIAK